MSSLCCSLPKLQRVRPCGNFCNLGFLWCFLAFQITGAGRMTEPDAFTLAYSPQLLKRFSDNVLSHCLLTSSSASCGPWEHFSPSFPGNSKCEVVATTYKQEQQLTSQPSEQQSNEFSAEIAKADTTAEDKSVTSIAADAVQSRSEHASSYFHDCACDRSLQLSSSQEHVLTQAQKKEFGLQLDGAASVQSFKRAGQWLQGVWLETAWCEVFIDSQGVCLSAYKSRNPLPRKKSKQRSISMVAWNNYLFEGCCMLSLQGYPCKQLYKILHRHINSIRPLDNMLTLCFEVTTVIPVLKHTCRNFF